MTPDRQATIRRFWREMQVLYADRNGTTKGLEQFAASETLSKAESDAQRAHAQGRIYPGKVTFSDAVVTKAELDNKTPRVTLSSCLDVSQWQPVDATTREPVTLPADRITKYQVRTTLEKWPQGWRLVRDEPQGKKC
ncbi:secreted protein/lipoprotein [Streptomyces sp. NPDC102259]|uniref:secreted protein/lipoprotein n=1 Tax=Streptomyces sp. NPDC102259 TaxID=3366148 RepID=UPI0038284029